MARGLLTDMTSQISPNPDRWKVLALLCTAFFMVTVDASVVLVALPSIGSELAFAPGDLSWVISAYMLSFGGLLLLGGRAADLLGRRRMFVVGTSLFALASLAAGFAGSPAALVAARVVQGIAGALMTPAALSILMTTFPEGAERNKALGVWTSTGAIGSVGAWLIGGPITDGLGWEWIFFVNVPVGLGVAALTPAFVRERDRVARTRRFDLAGAVTSTAGLVALVYAVVDAPTVGWADARTLGLLAAAVALLAAFVAIESRAAAPLAPLHVFRSRALVGGNLTLATLGMLAFGMPYVLTLYGQEVLGWSPVQFGLAFAVGPAMVAVGSSVGQRIATGGGLRSVATTGMALGGLGCLLLTQVSVGGSYFGDVFAGLVVFGLGLGAAYVSGSIASLSGVRESEAGLASGLNNASFQIGGAIGVAILSTVSLSAAGGGDRLTAMTNGFQTAFGVGIAFGVLGAIAAAALLRRPGATLPEAEVVPA